MTKIQKHVQIIPTTELATINKTSTALVAKAMRLEVTSAIEENNAYDVLGEIKKRLEEIEKRRTSITGPLNTSLKAANALFKTLSNSFKEADRIIRNKVLFFHQEQGAKAQETRDRQERAQAVHEAKGHETHQLEEVEADVGESVVTKRWTFEAVNLDKVPREYLTLNPSKVRDAIREGKRNIAGLRIYQEEGLRV